jgi:hypothetical protein
MIKNKIYINHKGIKPFWTEREYQYQQLIINGFIVQRELVGWRYNKTEKEIPRARIDIYYDTGEGVGIKKINGIESEVFKEACKFLNFGERVELNRKWITAKYLDNYDDKDPLCKKDLNSSELTPWIQFVDGVAKYNKDWVKGKEAKKTPDPIKDLFLTQDIDPKEVVGKKGLSTLYKHIKGDLDLTKKKALEYGAAINVAPQSLMFDPMRIVVWGNVNLIHNVTFNNADENVFPEVHTPGSIYIPLRVEHTICPAELYRVDIKCIRVRSKESIYDGFAAYYYEADKISDQAHNKLCIVRELLGKNHKYYFGIYQIYGNKKRILNPDPSSDARIIADDVNPDLVAPIISFTKPAALEADKMVSKNLEDAQKLGRLIREEEMSRIKLDRQRKLIADKVNEKSEKILKTLSKKQKVLDVKLQSFLTKIYYEAERSKIKGSFLGDLLKNKEDPAEVDYEIPSFVGSGYLAKRGPTADEIADPDQVLTQGTEIKLSEISRLCSKYKGSKYLQDKLKNDPNTNEIIRDGLNIDEIFDQDRADLDKTRVEDKKIKKWWMPDTEEVEWKGSPDAKQSENEITDIDHVLAKGNDIKLHEIDRLVSTYEGSKYLEDKLKNDPTMKKLFEPDGLDVSERFEEVRKEKANKEKSRSEMKRLFNEMEAIKDEENVA